MKMQGSLQTQSQHQLINEYLTILKIENNGTLNIPGDEFAGISGKRYAIPFDKQQEEKKLKFIGQRCNCYNFRVTNMQDRLGNSKRHMFLRTQRI
jgi:hypothetical protein